MGLENDKHLVDLPVGLTGLTSEEAQVKLQSGRNVIVPLSKEDRWLRWIGPLRDPMVILLLVACPIYLAIGENANAIATLLALAPIIAVGWALENRAKRTLEKLRNLVRPTCLVVRDALLVEIPTENLVVGDLVVISEGDIAPADCVVAEQRRISVDESSLTGESLPVEKTLDDWVLAGTTIMSGQTFVVVKRTGSNTVYGGMTTLVAKTKQPRTPLQFAIGKIVRTMATTAIVFALLVGLTEFMRNKSLAMALLAGISLLIAAIPEEFSIVYSLYLSLGAWKMSRERALVRNLPGVETLGSVTVICSDKTGTLTEGRVQVSSVIGFGVTKKDVLQTAVMACQPKSFDSLDVGIINAASDYGIDVTQLHKSQLLHAWPFDSHTAYVTQEWKSAGGVVVAAKGALEKLLVVARPPKSDHIIEAHDALTQQGTRVIAVARKDAVSSSGFRSNDEAGLNIIGLIGFDDPIRPEARIAIDQAHQAGIRVIMITGDHPATAEAIARKLGLSHADGSDPVVRSGDDVIHATSSALDAMVLATDVFARTRPGEKYLLVESLKRLGEVVAMTGDGVNDAAALRSAHIGVAMGERGTDVARESATIVLLDDNFATIVSATRNGRRIYDNLARAFAYLIAVHVPLVFLAFVIPLLGMPLLLVPMQLILFEVLLHPIVSLVFEVEPADPDVMSRPPRPSNYALTWHTLWRPFLLGSLLSIAICLIYSIAIAQQWKAEEARGLGFVALLLAQPLMILATRSGSTRLWQFHRKLTREFIGATIVVIATSCLVLFTALGHQLEVTAFPSLGWIYLSVALVCATLLPEFLKTKLPTTRGAREGS